MQICEIKIFTIAGSSTTDINFNLPGEFEEIKRIEVIANDNGISGLTPASIGDLFLKFGNDKNYYQTINRYDRVFDESTGIFQTRDFISLEELDYCPCIRFKLDCNKSVKGYIRNRHGSPLTYKLYLYP
jgi:hypothetical protein